MTTRGGVSVSVTTGAGRAGEAAYLHRAREALPELEPDPVQPV